MRVSYIPLLFLWLTTAVACAAIISSVCQFFADGWQLPRKRKVEATPAPIRNARGRQFLVMFGVWFLIIASGLVFLWKIGGTP